MQIAITSLGESLASPVDERFGRARFFIVFNSETEEWSVEDNRHNLQSSQGAGVRAAERLIERGVHTVITGHCGPKAFALLAAAGINVYQEARGSVQDAVKAFAGGSLEKSTQPDVKRGFGSKET